MGAMAARKLGQELNHAPPWLDRIGSCSGRYCRRRCVLRLVRNPGGEAQKETETTLGFVRRHQGEEAQNGKCQGSRTGKGDDDREHFNSGSDLPARFQGPD